LNDFFTKYVRGREELDYNGSLSGAGLKLETTAPASAAEKPYFGADLAQQGDRLLVTRVYAGSPAYEQGVNAGDQIVALNNMRVSKDFFEARLAEKKPGDLLNLTIFRTDDLSTLIIKLGERAMPPFRIVPLENPSEQQKQIYQSWLNSPLTK
jgi:predicted metalloprotease with PDZ domain